MSLQPGTKLGAYDIGASIGAGGMGEVYEAQDTKLDRRVAIKVLPDEGLARAGRSGKARAVLTELSERAQEEYVAPLHLAMIVSALGEMDRAFELLDEAVVKRNSWLAVPRMHLFDAFRDDPRFDEHLKRIGHPDRPQTG